MKFSGFPKVPTHLPKKYDEISYEYGIKNRKGATKITSLSKKMEIWLHKQVAKYTKNRNHLITLEIGAGSLNQIPYENTETYDVIEPVEDFYKDSPYKNRIRNFYDDIKDVPTDARYDRIISVATLSIF